MTHIFPPTVEAWRGIVSQYFGPFTDPALWVIQWESGGNAGAVGDNGASIGLFQVQHTLAGRPSAQWLSNPINNIQYAAQQLGGGTGNFGAWGQGTQSLPPYNPATGFGMFGSLGSHPFPADIAPTPDAILTSATTGPSSGTPSTTSPSDPIGNILGAIKDFITNPITHPVVPLIPGGTLTNPVGGITGAIAKIPGVSSLGDILKWIANPQSWFKLGFVMMGGILVILGVLILVKGMSD